MTMEVDTSATNHGIEIRYDGQPKTSFEPKIKTFFSHLSDFFPWLNESFIKIDSHNTFPHGAGIASSASAMSAMALCLMDINDQIIGTTIFPSATWWKQASEIARLGSGSASRSVFPKASVWGATDSAQDSSDQYAIPWDQHLSPVYKDFQDTILIISASEKSVSSSAGHNLMNDLAYAATRYSEARNNLGRLLDLMQHDDTLDQFIQIVESEALQLHALMMSGPAPFILMEPGTLSVIREVWRFRREHNIPVCFTLDAGPNVHLLYPAMHKEKILEWIKSSLVQFCADGNFIQDQVGNGPEKIEL